MAWLLLKNDGTLRDDFHGRSDELVWGETIVDSYFGVQIDNDVLPKDIGGRQGVFRSTFLYILVAQKSTEPFAANL